MQRALLDAAAAEEVEVETRSSRGSHKRYVVAAMIFLGLFNVYALRVNLSEAVDVMQSRFGWSDQTEGYVLSAFFWGYFCGQVPGAFLVYRYGGSLLFGLGVCATAILTLLLPVCARSGTTSLYLLRALMGWCEACTFPAANVMFSDWFPAKERTLLLTTVLSGAYLGQAFAYPLTTYMMNLHMDENGLSTSWPLVFYSFGAAGVVWFLCWRCIIFSTPDTHPTISLEEREYINSTSKADADVLVQKVEVSRSASPPWWHFVTNSAAWALYLNHFAYAWSFNILMTYLPKYLSEQVGYDLKSGGAVAVVPYLLLTATSLGAGRLAHYLSTRVMSMCATRVTLQLFAMATSSAALVAAGYMTSKFSATLMMSAAIGLSGFAQGGYACNYLDLSPHYVGYFFAIGNSVANTSGVLGPIVAGYILGGGHDDSDRPASVIEWRRLFYIAAGVNTVASVICVAAMKAKPLQELN